MQKIVQISDPELAPIFTDFLEQKSQNNRNDEWESQNILFV